MYSQLQIFYFVTNFCITVKGLEITNSYHVLCHKLQSISNEITGTQNYKISIECKPLYSQLQIFHFVYKLHNSQKFRNTTIFIPCFCATTYKTSIECEFPIHSKLQNFHNSQEFRSNKFISFITCEKMRNL
jgi:hypothetical protein